MIEQTKRKSYLILARTILISGLGVALNSLMTFFLVPVISGTVGTEAYGFVSLARNFEQYAMILTTALNSYAVRYIVIAYHEDRLDEANTYFSSTLYGDAVLGTGIFGAALIVIVLLERFVSISPGIAGDVKLLFFFVFVDFWIVTMTTSFSSAAHIRNKLDVAGVFKVAALLLEAVLLFVCYRFFSPHVYYVGVGRAVQAMVLAVGSLWIWRRFAANLTGSRRHASWKAVRQLVLTGCWNSLNSIGGVLNDGMDLWVCNLMLTPLRMGQLAIAKTFESFFSSIYFIVRQAFEPLFLKSYAVGDRESLLEELKLSMKVSGMISNIIFSGFLALGISFYRLWMPHEDIGLIYLLTVICNLATVPRGPMTPLYYIYVLTAKNRFPTIMTILSGALNVASMYLLLSFTDIGVSAIVWTTVAVSVLIDYVSNPLYMAHVLDLPWWTFYPNILRNLLSCALMSAVCMTLVRLHAPETWLGLFLCALVLAALGGALHLLVVMNRTDRRRALALLRSRKTN